MYLEIRVSYLVDVIESVFLPDINPRRLEYRAIQRNGEN